MKVLLSRQGGLFICGTNAFNPLCANYTVSTAYLKHTCTKMYCFGTSPHPLCFHYKFYRCFWGLYFLITFFSYFFYSLQPITFLTHILFYLILTNCFFCFKTSQCISEHCLQHRSKRLASLGRYAFLTRMGITSQPPS